MIKLMNIYKSYNKVNILEDINITFNKGLYVIYGINGSGKSTLLKIISGIIYKTKGTILNTDNISYLPDKFLMPKLLSVNTYIKLVLGEEYLYLLDKYKIPKKLIGNLSKGNLQKLGLIQILYQTSDTYILDEPLDGLDDEAKNIFKEDIINLLKENKTIIMSLHEKVLFDDINHISFFVKDGKCSEEL